jgi:hypothetical protein
MRHGFMQEVRSLADGNLPSGESFWLAQVDYVYEGRGDLERSPFTLVLIEAPASAGYAMRVLCHDRGMSKRDRDNPDSDRQVVKLDDKAVRLESDRFLDRYAVSTDHDQDQLSVWQLFDPSLLNWLTEAAPADFSFELQDGALSCFTPGFTAEEGELDALCAAATRVLARASAIAGDLGQGGMPRDGTRGDLVERELAAHPFEVPPKSTKAAAKAFRRGLMLGDEEWALGAEAFFRGHAAEVGFRPVPMSSYRAAHLDTFLPGVLAHVAEGSIAGGDADAFLVLTNDEAYDEMGWSSLVVDLRSLPPMAMAMIPGLPRGDASEQGSIRAGSDGLSLILSALDGGARDRSVDEFDSFFAGARALLARLRGQ